MTEHKNPAAGRREATESDGIFRPAGERFHTHIGWLQSWHSFSFGEHYDPAWTNWHGLVVVNDDIIQARSGFGEHGHRDMAIITWVLSGELEHRDSLGNGGLLRAGDVQVMQAGRGIRHSEVNPSPSMPLHLYQSWITPVAQGLPPTYDQRSVDVTARKAGWVILADRDGSRGGLRLGADATVVTTMLAAGEQREYALASGRHFWLQVCSGTCRVGARVLGTGDGLGLGQGPIRIEASAPTEILAFDLGA